MLGYFFLWVGIVVMIVAYQFGGEAVASHSITISMLTILLAYFTIGLVMLLSADIGTEHGLSFAVYLRAPFGIYWHSFPRIFCGIVAAAWFGIQTYLGALALNGIFQYLTGYDNWVVWYILFATVQVINTLLGIKAVEKFASFGGTNINWYIGLDVFLFGWSCSQLGGHNIWTFVGEGNTFLTFNLHGQSISLGSISS